jgi:hypothetical protein
MEYEGHKLVFRRNVLCFCPTFHIHVTFPQNRSYGDLRISSLSDAFAKLRKATISYVMSVCPHGTTRPSLDGFRQNLIFGIFFSENLSRKLNFRGHPKRMKDTLHEDVFTFMTISH